jgi:hypothetical protein
MNVTVHLYPEKTTKAQKLEEKVKKRFTSVLSWCLCGKKGTEIGTVVNKKNKWINAKGDSSYHTGPELATPIN